MYCKYCGQQIDDDSKFCKYCGMQLDNATNSSNASFRFDRKLIVVIAIIVIWYIVAYAKAIEDFYQYEYEINGIKVILSLRFATPLIMVLFNYLYKNYCKYPIVLFDKADSMIVNLLKYAYLVYSFFIPFTIISDVISKHFAYLGKVWLLPTVIICAIYYFVQSIKAAK